ncbi:hypothetical protein ABMA59_32265 [Mesorhizobium sp. CN2-181]
MFEPMTRYYFHTIQGLQTFRDMVGIELADEATAWSEATRACGEMIAAIDGTLPVGSDWIMEIEDNFGPLFRIRFGGERLR